VQHIRDEIRVEAPVEHVWKFYCETTFMRLPPAAEATRGYSAGGSGGSGIGGNSPSKI
jgi:ligand-binding SRPBCC domain-containing protein